MAALAAFLTLAMLGIMDTGYLIYQHRKKKPLICPMTHDCSKVTESKYARLFGIRNEVLGFLFYIAMLASGILLIIQPLSAILLLPFIFIATLLSLLTSSLLSLIEIFKIKDYCFYCILSAIINLLLFITSIFLVSSIFVVAKLK